MFGSDDYPGMMKKKHGLPTGLSRESKARSKIANLEFYRLLEDQRNLIQNLNEVTMLLSNENTK